MSQQSTPTPPEAPEPPEPETPPAGEEPETPPAGEEPEPDVDSTIDFANAGEAARASESAAQRAESAVETVVGVLEKLGQAMPNLPDPPAGGPGGTPQSGPSGGDPASGGAPPPGDQGPRLSGLAKWYYGPRRRVGDR